MVHVLRLKLCRSGFVVVLLVVLCKNIFLFIFYISKGAYTKISLSIVRNGTTHYREIIEVWNFLRKMLNYQQFRNNMKISNLACDNSVLLSEHNVTDHIQHFIIISVNKQFSDHSIRNWIPAVSIWSRHFLSNMATYGTFVST